MAEKIVRNTTKKSAPAAKPAEKAAPAAKQAAETVKKTANMQNIAEHANALLETGDSEYADLIRTEVKDLWSWLK